VDRGVRVIKRAVDVAGAAVGLTVTLPLYVPIGIAILLESSRPIFYVQRRAGHLVEHEDGSLKWTEFDMLKFRTMRTDAERGTGAVIAAKNDARVTRVGRFLRATRLDELPQFWNVLRGDMSLVGPRPERLELLASLTAAIPYFEERTREIRAGITGLAQVSLGYTGEVVDGTEISDLRASLTNPFEIPEAEGAIADDMRLKLLLDLAYAVALEDLWSYLRMEATIVLKTPWVMARRLGR
jgi:lipopolysaccharide/colanic/teichoic acid biosynthesis glycosyltransferase